MVLDSLDYGHEDSFVVYVNVTYPYSRGFLDDAAVRTLFDRACAVVKKTATAGRPLGQFRLTTKDPSGIDLFWDRSWGLRPGECLEVRFVPSLRPWGGVGAGGLTTRGYEHCASLYDRFECYACLSNPLPAKMWPMLGVTVVHEALHAVMPWSGRYGDQHLHSPLPDNVLYANPTEDPVVTQQQRDALVWNFDRCRRDGLRVGPAGWTHPVPVYDGGRPAWPKAT